MKQGFDKELYTKNICVRDLKVGDILAQDVYLRQGTLVAKAGIELNQSHIDRMKQMSNRIVTLDQRKLYIRGISASKNLMKQANTSKSIEKKEVFELIEPFIEEVKREKNLFALLEQLETKDEYTFQHTINIGILSYIIGDWYGLKGDELHRLSVAGTLHDIGKSKIPPGILNKPGPLSNQEFYIMKKHPEYGVEILSRSGQYEEDIILGVLQHHEREDGSGYPYGLKREKIHTFAKIIAVADIYHAMTTDRCYRLRTNPYHVLSHLKKNIYNLDVEITHLVINKMLTYLQGGKVVLSNGKSGDVIYIDQEEIALPLVKTVDGEFVDLKKNQGISIIDVIYDLNR